MNVSAPFVARPIATTLLMTGVTLIGIVAYMVDRSTARLEREQSRSTKTNA